MPTATDYACIPAAAGPVAISGSAGAGGVDAEGPGLTIQGTLNLTGTTQPSIINAVTLSGSLGTAAPLTLNGQATWYTGSLFGTGTFINTGTLSLFTNGTLNIYTLLVNQGTIRPGPGNSASLCIFDGNTLENSATLAIAGSTIAGTASSNCGAGNGSGRLLNDAGGTITGTGTISSLFDNNGVVTLAGGALDIRNGNSPGQADSGTYQTAAGGGSINFKGGTRNFAPASNVAGGDTTGVGVHLLGGAVTGTLGLTGEMYWGETFSAGGTFMGATLTGPGRLHMSTNQTLTLAGNLVNRATIEGEYGGFGNGLCIADGATLENAGTMSVPSGGITICAGNTGTGTLRNDAGASLTANLGFYGSTSVYVPLTNAGTVEVDGGTLSIRGSFANYDSGTRALNGGTYKVLQAPNGRAGLAFGNADVVSLNATVIVDGRDAGVTDLANTNGLRDLSTITSGGSLTLRDDPTPITTSGALTNQGTLGLGSGTRAAIIVTGNYAQASSATIQVETGGGSLGQLSVSGTASLGGTLAILTPGGVPGAQSFTVLNAGSVSGTFSSVSGTALSNGQSFQVLYQATSVQLFVGAGQGGAAALFSSNPAIPATWPGTLPIPGGQSTAGINLPFAFGGVQFDLHKSGSQHILIAGDASGSQQFCVDGQWTLSLAGPASPGITGSGCHARIDISQLGIPDGLYGIQMTLTAPPGNGTLGSSTVYLVTPNVDFTTVADNFRAQPLGIRFPVQVGGSLTLSVGASGTLNVMLSSTLLPLAGLQAFFTYDSIGLSAGPVALATGWSGTSGDGILEYGAPKSSGTIFTLPITCLRTGLWPVSVAGHYWTPGASNGAGYTEALSGIPTVTCSQAPATPTTRGLGLVVDHATGGLIGTIVGSGLDRAASAYLLDANGFVVSGADSVTPAAGGTSLSASFPPTPPGAYQMVVNDTSGVQIASTGSPPSLIAPFASPVIHIQAVDALNQVLGIPTAHIWQLRNTGLVDGVAVVHFTFPSYLAQPAFQQAIGPSGVQLLAESSDATSWSGYIAAPVAAGTVADLVWTVTLPQAAGSIVPLGSEIPMKGQITGLFTAAEWLRDGSFVAPPDFVAPVDPSVVLTPQLSARAPFSFAGQIQMTSSTLSGPIDVSVAGVPTTTPIDPNVTVSQVGGAVAFTIELTAPGSGLIHWIVHYTEKSKDVEDKANEVKELVDARKKELNELNATKCLIDKGCLPPNDTVTLTNLAKGEFAIKIIDKLVPDEAAAEWKAVDGVMDTAWATRLKTIATQGDSALNFLDCIGYTGPFPPTGDQVVNAVGKCCEQSATEQPTRTGGFDPNSLTALPAGIGSASWVKPQRLTYVVHFENLPAATGAAHDVRVTAKLDPSLDPNSLQFAHTSFPATQVSFDPGSGLLTWVLPGINLPPDTNPPAGEGWVSFSALPIAGVVTGTPIVESATVFFDFEPPIATQATLRTIDGTPPQSRVSSLPNAESTLTFPVSWSGTDVGSGVNTFTIFVSDNHGALVPWVVNSPATSQTFSGQPGHTYAFYSLAKDLVGNPESPRSVADTSTTVVLATQTLLASSANPSVFGQPVAFTAIISPVPDGGTVQFYVDGVAFGSPTQVDKTSGLATTTSIASLSVGSHAVSAVYSGDSGFLGSAAPALPQIVSRAGTTTTVASSQNPTFVGKPVTLTATVSVVAPGAGSPTGTVQFKVNGNNVGATVLLTGGQASLTTSALAIGHDAVTATYGGDGNFTGSIAPPLIQLVRNNVIGFSSTRDGNLELYIMKPDGTVQTRLTFNPAQDSEPVLSPDGTRVAFTSTRSRSLDIWVMNTAPESSTNVATDLTKNSAINLDPTWSPDGSRIAFASNRSGRFQIWMMNRDGTGLVRLTNDAANDLNPAWSPDGTRLAFASDASGRFQIYVGSLSLSPSPSLSSITRLTSDSATDLTPAWSPDGRLIAYTGTASVNPEIWVISSKPGGVGVRETSNRGAFDMTPTWSPDGTRIAFTSITVWSVQIDEITYNSNGLGTAQTRVTSGATNEFPNWCCLAAP